MRKLFAQTVETQKLIALFKEMSINQRISFAEASKRVGFKVTSALAAYHSARWIATRDHHVIIEGIKGFGFERLNGGGMVRRGQRFLRAIRRKANRGAAEQEIALLHNLDRNEQMQASLQLNRFRLIADVAGKPVSNRHQPEQLPIIQRHGR